MAVLLYTLRVSPPGRAVQAMLAHKGIDHECCELVPGLHAKQLKQLGFGHPTVPALQVGARRVQNSRAIARLLDELEPAARLFPVEPHRRQAVMAAEVWGEVVLQEATRRIFRYLCGTSAQARRWVAQTSGLPGADPGAGERAARALARAAGASAAAVQADLAALRGRLDQVTVLLGRRVIGRLDPNAADFQIAAAIQALRGLADLAPRIGRHPAAVWATTVVSSLAEPCPAGLPADWIEPVGRPPIAGVLVA